MIDNSDCNEKNQKIVTPIGERAFLWPFVILGVLITAGCYYISAGLGTIGFAAWIAPIAVLLIAFRNARRTAWLSAGIAYFLGSLNLLTYLARVMPILLVLILLLIPAIVYAIAVLITRYGVNKLNPVAAIFVFPAAWVSYEFLLSLLSPHGTALSIAYSQTDFLPLLQLASITGIWGITFIVTLIPASIAVALHRRKFTALVPPIIIMLVVFSYGIIRLHQPQEGSSVRVGLSATDQNIIEAFSSENAEQALGVAHAYAARIKHLALHGAQVIILPEKFLGVTPSDSAEIMKVFGDAARTEHVTVIAGLNRIAIKPKRNVAVIFAPDGSVITEYDKHHFLPGAETGYQAGLNPGFFTAPGGQWGVAICKDMDFPPWIRKYGQNGVRYLVVPAWDFIRDGRMHSRMAVVRGVENGFSVARTAQEGLLTISDAYGRIIAESPSSTMPEAYLVHDIAPGPGDTFYSRYGNWFGWCSIFVLIALLITAALKRVRKII